MLLVERKLREGVKKQPTIESISPYDICISL